MRYVPVEIKIEEQASQSKEIKIHSKSHSIDFHFYKL